MTNKQEIISRLDRIVKDRGGVCFSDYVNSREKLKLQCKYGHSFSMCWNKIQRGQWCPVCSKGISERICKAYFERIFGKEFRTVRPKWLVGDKGRPLELDGYCEELQIAFEHNGSQHYKKASNISNYEFKRLQFNDRIKKELCKKNGVKLIVIPELFVQIKPQNLSSFLKEEFRKQEIIFPDYEEMNIDEIYQNRNVESKNGEFIPLNSKYTIDDINKVASLHEGKCLSTYYDSQRMQFECKRGHKWFSSPSHIMKNNTWCLKCHIANKISKNNLLTKEVIIEACKTCTSFQQIAEKYNVSWLTARKYCKKYNITPLK